MGMTIAEKILSRASGSKRVSANDYVTARVDMAMMPENFRLIKSILKRAGIAQEKFQIWNPEKLVVIVDHRVPATSLDSAENHKMMRSLSKSLNVKYFYDLFAGICHQVMIEKGHVLPGELIVGADSHTTTYGALNAAGTGIGASEMAYVIQTGELWFRVPETIRFLVQGKFSEFVLSKDLVLHIAGRYGTDIAQYKSIEWKGAAIETLSVDGRLTLANMSAELGAKFGLFSADERTLEYLEGRTNREFEPVESDPDADFLKEYVLNVSELEPQIAFPHSVSNVKPVSQAYGIEIDQAVIASCCHGRIEDLEIGARILKGKRVASGTRLFIAPASWEVYKEASAKGLLASLIDSGAMIGNPSCGFCTGFQGVLADGERCIAACPRNFRGRMGSPKAEIYLASPATVAASAIAGKIVDPRELL